MEHTKKYYEVMNEITKDELLEGFLGFGFFAEEIPPFLTSQNFYEFCVKNESIAKNFKQRAKKFIRYYSIRNTNVPRMLAIPHPIAYYRLCNVLSENWEKLKPYFEDKTNNELHEDKTKNQTHKVSKIHIRKLVQKQHIFEMNYRNFQKDGSPEPDLLIGKEYLVRADISTCFPSLYSHAIPWALVGKETAKLNRKDSEYYNAIDTATRNLKEQETAGILIGPHASHLISEIVLVAIDKKLFDKGFKDYIRYVDDYIFFAKTHQQAEEFLITLDLTLREYNWSLNHKKTEILKLPTALDGSWTRELNAFRFDKVHEDYFGFKDVQAFMNLVLELMQKHDDNSSIINYAAKILGKGKLTDNAINYYIKTIHHLVLIYPYLVKFLEKDVFVILERKMFSEKNNILLSKIETISRDLFSVGYQRNLYETMSYAVYFAIRYNFQINFEMPSKTLFQIAEESKDCILMLVSYLYEKKNNSSLSEYETLAKGYVSDDEYWLFSYEVLDESELEDDDLKKLKKKNISFIRQDIQWITGLNEILTDIVFPPSNQMPDMP